MIKCNYYIYYILYIYYYVIAYNLRSRSSVFVVSFRGQTTRFALACNISSKIIEPIQSRCAILRFGRISEEDMMQRLKLVLEKEAAKYDQSGLEALIFAAEGDMRNALNGAQPLSATRLFESR